MTPAQKEYIRADWRLVEPIRDQAAALFYERLFELDPSVIPLFGGTDMVRQGRMLMQTLGVVVASLDALERVVPAIEALGRRHVAYGVQPAHYATVGSALLWTLEQGLGPAFGPEDREAWAEAYGIVAGLMVAAAETEELTERRVEVAA